MSFRIGQRIVCIDSENTGSCTPLIEGKTYIVANDGIFLCGIPNSIYWEGRFIPEYFDRQADEEIKSALNESLKVKL